MTLFDQSLFLPQGQPGEYTWKSAVNRGLYRSGLLARMNHGLATIPPVAVAGDIPTVTTSGTATITAQLVGAQSGLVTEVGSRGVFNSTFGRLPVTQKSGLDFYLSGTACEIHVFPGFTGSCPIWIWVNGAPYAATPGSVSVTASTDIYVKLTFGSSDRRRVEVFMPHTGSWYDVRASLSSVITPAPRKPVVAWVGDSFYNGSSGTPMMQCADFLASRLLGVECYSQSYGGTGYVTAGSFQTFGDPARVALVSAATPELIIMQGSLNDDGAAGIQAAATAAFAAYAAACPQAQIIVLGPQPNAATATLSTNRSLNIAAVKAAAIAAPNVLAFHDLVGTATSVPAAAATFQTYPDGTLLSSLGSVWQVSNNKTAYAGGPLLPPVDGHFVLQTWALFGTGQVGTTTGDGTRDTYVYSDGIHPTAEASIAYAIRTAQTIRADLVS